MGSIKDRNGMDLTEAEDIKKRWQEYTEEMQKSTMDVWGGLTIAVKRKKHKAKEKTKDTSI